MWRNTQVALVALLSIAVLANAADAQGKKRAGKKQSTAELIRSLSSAETDVAARAATALGASKGKVATAALLDALALGAHPKVAAASLDALRQHRSPRSYDTLTKYIHHRNARVRAAAISALGALDDRRVERPVLAALRDGHETVRAAAADVVGKRAWRPGIETLLALLKKGDEAAAPALARLADPDLARAVGELLGEAPDGPLARCLGAILMRPKFKPEEARVQVVRALGKVPGNEALEQLTNYVGSIPEKPPRQSRREAEALIESRLSGGE